MLADMVIWLRIMLIFLCVHFGSVKYLLRTSQNPDRGTQERPRPSVSLHTLNRESRDHTQNQWKGVHGEPDASGHCWTQCGLRMEKSTFNPEQSTCCILQQRNLRWVRRYKTFTNWRRMNWSPQFWVGIVARASRLVTIWYTLVQTDARGHKVLRT